MVRFWTDRWLGRDCFDDLFPTLYSRCSNKEVVVEELGWWEDGVWKWDSVLVVVRRKPKYSIKGPNIRLEGTIEENRNS